MSMRWGYIGNAGSVLSRMLVCTVDYNLCSSSVVLLLESSCEFYACRSLFDEVECDVDTSDEINQIPLIKSIPEGIFSVSSAPSSVVSDPNKITNNCCLLVARALMLLNRPRTLL